MPEDGYPTEDELKRVREWPIDDPTGWLAYVRSIGHWWPEPDPFGWHEFDGKLDGKPARWYFVSTGGWSGNEDIIEAMQEAQYGVPWGSMWQQHNVGGHYRFAVVRRKKGADDGR